MKKHLFLSLVGALALTACSSDDPMEPVIEGGNGTQTAAGTHYLSVNIVSTPSANGKAEGGQATGDPNGNATYEEGYASENKVNKVRFYFFDINGDAADVRHDNDGLNFFDWDPEVGGQDMPNVEKILNATIVISTPEGHELPSKMMAVINPDTEVLGNVSLSINQLRGRTKDYVAAATGENGAFVMTNSVYANGTSEIVCNDVDSKYYEKTEEAAKGNPVNIYVERNVAKVRVKFADGLGTKQADGSYLIPLKDSKGKDILVDGKQVYLHATGWNVEADSKMGYFSKHIDATWSNTLFGAEPWNWGPYFRSYWAINSFLDADWEANLNWKNYNTITSLSKKFDGELANSIYVNENAPQALAADGVERFTKAVIAGTLCYENGEAVEVAIFMGARMAGEEALKTALLAQLQQNGMYYKVTKTTEGETTTVYYNSLTEDDVTFVTALAAGASGVTESETTQGRYIVYLQVKDADAMYSTSDAKEQNEEDWMTGAQVNTKLAEKFHNLQVYNEGMTYYYFPIEHLGEDGKVGEYGVVRNHIYDCVINSIAGLGTPVYDPTETIYPEKPENEETYIAAKINILSWRVVPNNVDLNW